MFLANGGALLNALLSVGSTERVEPAHGRQALFVPLAGPPFAAFYNGVKTVEVRQDAPRWSDKHVFPGRAVLLRRGYSTPDELARTVGRVWRGFAPAAPAWVVEGARIDGWPVSRYFDAARPVVAFECLPYSRAEARTR